MKKKYILCFSALVILLLFSTCTSNNSEKLVIAAAANMQFAIKEIALAFTKETGIVCEPIIGSSGKLTAQIKEGAPFDIFVSADLKYPEDLFQNGFTKDRPSIYAYGKLVLWTLAKTPELKLTSLSSPTLNHLALPNPRNAPYGKAAVEILEHFQLTDALKDKIVYGESISQTNQFIRSKVVDLGFTAKSVVLSPFLRGEGQWLELDQNLYTPIAQGIVLLNNREDQALPSQQFKEFLFSKKGKEILIKFGFSLNDLSQTND